ncbi:MAG: efflux RND transporter periplasmic adaptor subunit [Candidatus Kapabacteria bacterium]|nr:efflux RND transporter periplasmic adaptor subunit [Ignavibacteriota bacterium]MCW5885478.1 efflux RND transporter periplasmic adaptor subunit [Candidatus Kapabacteria bacterium]
MNKNLAKKIFLWSLVFIAILALVLPKFLSKQSDDIPTLESKANNTKSEITVNAIVAEFSNVSKTVFAIGTLLGDEEIELKSEISGRITKLNLVEGARVRKGDLLIKLNDNDLQAQLKKAEERLKYLQLTESRQKLLFEKQGISRQDYDLALSELTSQKAEIDYIKAMIERTEIRAPFDGVAGLKYVSEGAYITPSSTIVSLQKIDFLKIDFSVPQKYYNYVSKGSLLKFRVPPDTTKYHVSVLATEPKIDELTRTFKIRGRFSNLNKNLLPGSYAEVDIITDDRPNTIMIPSIALIPDLKSEYVFVFKNGVVDKRDVRTGTRNPEQIEITGGLNQGDTIITSGIMQIKPGDTVRVSINNYSSFN